jgi:hypothetical protein
MMGLGSATKWYLAKSGRGDALPVPEGELVEGKTRHCRERSPSGQWSGARIRVQPGLSVVKYPYAHSHPQLRLDVSLVAALEGFRRRASRSAHVGRAHVARLLYQFINLILFISVHLR